MPEQQKQYTQREFGALVKQKYPQYKDFDDAELASRVLEKYPGYQQFIAQEGAPPATTPPAEVTAAPPTPESTQAASAAMGRPMGGGIRPEPPTPPSTPEPEQEVRPVSEQQKLAASRLSSMMGPMGTQAPPRMPEPPKPDPEQVAGLSEEMLEQGQRPPEPVSEQQKLAASRLASMMGPMGTQAPPQTPSPPEPDPAQVAGLSEEMMEGGAPTTDPVSEQQAASQISSMMGPMGPQVPTGTGPEEDVQTAIQYEGALPESRSLIPSDAKIEADPKLDFWGQLNLTTPQARKNALRAYQMMQQDLLEGGWIDAVPFLSSIKGAHDLARVYSALNRKQSGEADEYDERILSDYIQGLEEAEAKGENIWYGIYDLAKNIPAFGGEIAITAPIYRLGSKQAQKFVLNRLKKFAETKAGQVAAKGAGIGAGTALQSAANVPRVGENTLQRIVHDGDSLATAIPKALVDNYIEYLSERGGAGIPILGKGVGKLADKLPYWKKAEGLKTAIANRWFQKNPGAKPSAFNELLKRAGWHGMFAEVLEERFGELARGAVGATGVEGFDFEIPTVRQLFQEAVAFSIPGAAGLAYSRLSPEDFRQQLERWTEIVSSAKTPEEAFKKAPKDIKKAIQEEIDAGAELEEILQVGPQPGRPDRVDKGDLIELDSADGPIRQRVVEMRKGTPVIEVNGTRIPVETGFDVVEEAPDPEAIEWGPIEAEPVEEVAEAPEEVEVAVGPEMVPEEMEQAGAVEPVPQGVTPEVKPEVEGDFKEFKPKKAPPKTGESDRIREAKQRDPRLNRYGEGTVQMEVALRGGLRPEPGLEEEFAEIFVNPKARGLDPIYSKRGKLPDEMAQELVLAGLKPEGYDGQSLLRELANRPKKGTKAQFSKNWMGNVIAEATHRGQESKFEEGLDAQERAIRAEANESFPEIPEGPFELAASDELVAEMVPYIRGLTDNLYFADTDVAINWLNTLKSRLAEGQDFIVEEIDRRIAELTDEKLEEARAEVETDPTEAQKEAGNYKKGHLKLHGLDISIENPKGSTRKGTDRDGNEWESQLAHDYGYIRKTEGNDADQVDVFIGPNPNNEKVWVVDQVDPETGEFDEHKVMMGFESEEDAEEGYLDNYEEGWEGLDGITEVPIDEFKQWVREGDKSERFSGPTLLSWDLRKKTRKRIRQRKDFKKKHGEATFQVEVPQFGMGAQAIIHRSTKNPGMWQQTIIDDRGPRSDTQWPTWDEAVEDLVQNSSVDLSKAQIAGAEPVSPTPAPAEEAPSEEQEPQKQSQAEIESKLADFFGAKKRTNPLEEAGLSVDDLSDEELDRFLQASSNEAKLSVLQEIAKEKGTPQTSGVEEPAEPEVPEGREAWPKPEEIREVVERNIEKAPKEIRSAMKFGLKSKEAQKAEPSVWNPNKSQARRLYQWMKRNQGKELDFGEIEEIQGGLRFISEAGNLDIIHPKTKTGAWSMRYNPQSDPVYRQGGWVANAVIRDGSEVELSAGDRILFDWSGAEMPAEIQRIEESESLLDNESSLIRIKTPTGSSFSIRSDQILNTGDQANARYEDAAKKSQEVQEKVSREYTDDEVEEARSKAFQAIREKAGDQASEWISVIERLGEVDSQPRDNASQVIHWNTVARKVNQGQGERLVSQARDRIAGLEQAGVKQAEWEQDLLSRSISPQVTAEDRRKAKQRGRKEGEKAPLIGDQIEGPSPEEIAQDRAKYTVRKQKRLIASKSAAMNWDDLMAQAQEADPGNDRNPSVKYTFENGEIVHSLPDYQEAIRRAQSQDMGRLLEVSPLTDEDLAARGGGVPELQQQMRNLIRQRRSLPADVGKGSGLDRAIQIERSIQSTGRKLVEADAMTEDLKDAIRPFVDDVDEFLGIAPDFESMPADSPTVEMGQLGGSPRYKKFTSRRHEHGDMPTSYMTGKSNDEIRKAARKNPGIGLMLTPATSSSYFPHATDYSHVAIDNGAFSESFSREDFLGLLDKVAEAPDVKKRVIFAVAPDVVGDAEATLERSQPYFEEIRARGIPVAFVAQDGAENMIDRLPWDEFDVLFIGGTTDWKLGRKDGKPNREFMALIKEAHGRGKPIHMGRVNSWKRFELAGYGLGIQSVDGTYLKHGPDVNLPKVEEWLQKKNANMELPQGLTNWLDQWQSLSEEERREQLDLIPSEQIAQESDLAVLNRAREALRDALPERGTRAWDPNFIALNEVNRRIRNIEGLPDPESEERREKPPRPPHGIGIKRALTEEEAEQRMQDLLDRYGIEDPFDLEQEYWNEKGDYFLLDPEKVSAEKVAKDRAEFLSEEAAQKRVDRWKEYARELGKSPHQNRGKVILSLFDRTGAWVQPYVDAGYDVRVIDMAFDDVDVMDINADWLADYDLVDVHGIIAACPCTDFAGSGARWWKEKDASGKTQASIDLVNHTLGIINHLKPDFWVIENPVGRIQKITNIPAPQLQFQPHNYGDPYTKRTLLFGNFDPRLPQANVEPTEGSFAHRLRGDVPEQKAKRSETFDGFAYAFFMANHQHGQYEWFRDRLQHGGPPRPSGSKTIQQLGLGFATQGIGEAAEGETSPPPVDISEYVLASEESSKKHSNYFDEQGEKKASSRTTPMEPETYEYPLGTWRIQDQATSKYGHEIDQLREYDPDDLETSEQLEPARKPDVRRYKKWAQEGRAIPPIEAVETEAGRIRVTDGHRRLQAARELDIPIRVWVSPTAPVPTGMKDAAGDPIQTGLTYEMAHPNQEAPSFEEAPAAPPGQEEPGQASEFNAIEPDTEGATLQMGVGEGISRMPNAFVIQTDDGSKIEGFLGTDFPNDAQSPTRGEIFWTETTRPKQGTGTSLVRDALRLMQANGITTVNFSPVTRAGERFLEKLIRQRLVSEPVRTSETGKSEHEILLGQEQEPRVFWDEDAGSWLAIIPEEMPEQFREETGRSLRRSRGKFRNQNHHLSEKYGVEGLWEFQERPQALEEFIERNRQAPEAAPEEVETTPEETEVSSPKREPTNPREKAFAEIATMQREVPERTMLQIQRDAGGGVFNTVVEDAGDLIHRMTEPSAPYQGWDAIREKVKKLKTRFLHKYGFEREMEENISGNFKFYKEEGRLPEGVETLEEYRQHLKDLSEKYAEEHRALPVYNRPQEIAQDIAVAVGEWRFQDALDKVRELDIISKDRHRWVEAARQYDPNYERQTEVSSPKTETDREKRIRLIKEAEDAWGEFYGQPLREVVQSWRQGNHEALPSIARPNQVYSQKSAEGMSGKKARRILDRSRTTGREAIIRFDNEAGVPESAIRVEIPSDVDVFNILAGDSRGFLLRNTVEELGGEVVAAEEAVQEEPETVSPVEQPEEPEMPKLRAEALEMLEQAPAGAVLDTTTFATPRLKGLWRKQEDGTWKHQDKTASSQQLSVFQALVERNLDWYAPLEAPVESRRPLAEEMFKEHERPTPEIVEVFQLKGDDGKWYHQGGFPIGVKYTGDKRGVGYAYENESGVRFGKRFETEEEARQWWQDYTENDRREFVEHLLVEHEEQWNQRVENWANTPERERLAEDLQSPAPTVEPEPEPTPSPPRLENIQDTREFVREQVEKAASEAWLTSMRNPTGATHIYYRPGELTAKHESEDTAGLTIAIQERVPTNLTEEGLRTWIQDRIGDVPFLPTEETAIEPQEQADVPAAEAPPQAGPIGPSSTIHLRTRELPFDSIKDFLKEKGLRQRNTTVHFNDHPTRLGASVYDFERKDLYAIDLETGELVKEHEGVFFDSILYGSKEQRQVHTKGVDTYLPEGVAIIEVTVGGDTPGAEVYLNTAYRNQGLLKDALDVRDQQILSIYSTLKSFARPDEIERQNVSPEEIDRLVEKGYLKRNKRGHIRITNEGKNAISALPLHMTAGQNSKFEPREEPVEPEREGTGLVSGESLPDMFESASESGEEGERQHQKYQVEQAWKQKKQGHEGRLRGPLFDAEEAKKQGDMFSQAEEEKPKKGGGGSSGVMGFPDQRPIAMRNQAPDPWLRSPDDVPEQADLSMDMSLEPEIEVKGEPTTPPEIVKAHEDIVKAAGKIIRILPGRMRSRRALGEYVVRAHVIRIRGAHDFPTIAHETAHALEKAIYGWVKGSPWKSRPKDMQDELMALGKALYGDTSPSGGYKREGWAEFFRYYMTGEKAPVNAPRTTQWFEEEFLQEHREVAEAIKKAREALTRFRKQGAIERAKGSIWRPSPLRERVKKALAKDNLKKKWIEEFSPLEELSKVAASLRGSELEISEDPYLTASALRHTAPARVHYMVENRMIDLAGNPTGVDGLKAIRGMVKGKQMEFTLYLWGRHGVDTWKRGINPGISKEDAKFLADQFASPEFELAAERVYEWNRSILQYAVQGGLLPQEQMDAMVKTWTHYIPLSRAFEDIDGDFIKQVRGNPRSDPFKDLKGSPRRIKDPFESMISNATYIVGKTHERIVLNNIFRLRHLEDIGPWIHEVPRDKVRQIVSKEAANMIFEFDKGGGDKRTEKIKMKDVFDRILEDLQEEGLDVKGMDEISGWVEMFSYAHHPKGQDPIVPFVDEFGNMRWYYVNEKLYDSIQKGMDPYRFGKVADLLVAAPARMFKLGTTGLRASFSLVTNPLRDFQTFVMQTQSGARADELTMAWAQSLRAAFNKELKGESNDEFLDAFERMGGAIAQPLGMDVDYTRRSVRSIFQDYSLKGITMNPMDIMHQGLDALRDKLQIPESASRAAELRVRAKEVGWVPGEAMTFDQSLQLLLDSKRVTVDFSAAGTWAKFWNQVAPFFNPAIQGSRIFTRVMKENPARAIIWGLSYITIPTLFNWWANRDDDWYQDMPWWERYTYWNVQIGDTVLRIPKAYEWGSFFAVVPEALFNAWYQQNPESFLEAMGFLFETVPPDPFSMPGARVLWEQQGNKVGFTDAPIVPRGEVDMAPGEQIGPYTSKTAEIIADAFNLVGTHVWEPISKDPDLPGILKWGQSPRRIDHAIRGFFGGLGPDLIQTIESVGGAAQEMIAGEGISALEEEWEASDIPVFGRLIRPGGTAGYASLAVDELYDEYQRMDRQYKTLRTRREQEPERDRLYRLLLKDAASHITALSYISTHTDDTEPLRKIQRAKREDAREALSYRDKTTEEIREKYQEKIGDVEAKFMEQIVEAPKKSYSISDKQLGRIERRYFSKSRYGTPTPTTDQQDPDVLRETAAREFYNATRMFTIEGREREQELAEKIREKYGFAR